MDRRVDDPTDSGLRLHTFGFDGQPAGDTSAFLRAVAVELPEARQDSAFHADVANADKLADAWSLRDESHLKGSNDTNATMDVFAIAQAALIIMGGNLSPATKPCDSCGGEFEIGSFSKKEWRAAGWGRCRSCVQKGKRARYSDFYRPAVPGSSKIDGGILCHPDHPDPLAAILREYLTEDYGTDCVERLIKAALEYPTTFKHYLRLYYYKLYLLDSLKKAGVPSDVVLNLRRAIYDIPDYFRRDGKLTSSTFHQFTDPIRQAMSKGKKKLRLASKKVFLAMDEVSERVPLNDIKKYVDGDTAEAMTREELIERRADEAGFVPSIERLVDDLVPMLRPEHRDHIDRFLMGPNGTPLTSEQRKHPDWIKLVRLCFNFYVGSKRNIASMRESSTVASSASETNSGNRPRSHSGTSRSIWGYRCGDDATTAESTKPWLSGYTPIVPRATPIGCLPISAGWTVSIVVALSVCSLPNQQNSHIHCDAATRYT